MLFRSLEIKDLYKCYGKKEALKNVSFSMTPGIYGLLGPNGAGKSTLIGILTGNLKADRGTIYFNGENVNEIDQDYRRNGKRRHQRHRACISEKDEKTV